MNSPELSHQPHLASPFDTFPDAEISHHPDEQQTQRQLPADGARCVDAF